MGVGIEGSQGEREMELDQGQHVEADDVLATAPGLREKPGTLHLTLSFLVEYERLRAIVGQADGTTLWTKALLGRLRDHEDSRRLGHAIEPLFNDIADRKRGLFIEEFLIDTPGGGGAAPDGQNTCDRITVRFPGAIDWSTEGERFGVRLEAPVALEGTCRAFWVAHSNTSLTWHLSLELPYRHDPAHYYAMALLQKAIFPTEGTRWLYGDGGVRVESRAHPTAAPRAFHDYVTALFDMHAGDLLEAVSRILVSAGSKPRTLPESPWRHLLAPPGASPEGAMPEPAARPALGEMQCRTLFLLEDPHFFALLGPQVRHALPAFAEVATRPADAGGRLYDEATLLAAHPAQLDYFFLSGFLQNIVDFLRQDASEVQDGTDPIYPPPDMPDGDSHFLVYATQTSLYEIVAGSRSLNVGRGWIGTCPYLFLVHLMTMHNEALVQRYEGMVRRLIGELDDRLLEAVPMEAGSGGRDYPAQAADRAFELFRRFRLATFSQIAKHRYFNVLRYDTERTFYESIERVRGIAQRQDYWAEVVADLEKTLDDVRQNESQKSDRFLERVLFYVTFLGIAQVLFQMVEFWFDSERAKFPLGVGSIALVALLMLMMLRRRDLLGRRVAGWLRRGK